MANKRTGWSVADFWKRSADEIEHRIRKEAADKERAKSTKQAERSYEDIQMVKRLRKMYDEDPTAYRDRSVMFYRNPEENEGLNDWIGSPRDKQDAKKILQDAFNEDKKKKKTK